MSFDVGATADDRYARHRLIDWWDQAKILAARVLVVGAGALGNEVIKNLALLGIGRITIVDSDRVEISNLSRSVLYTHQDVGRAKAHAAADAVVRLNDQVDVSWINGDLEFAIGVAEVRDHDFILGCLDSVNARWALNRLALAAGVPWINAGINPTAGEISLFMPDRGACYECAMTDAMWRRFNERYSCNKLLKSLPPRALPTTITVAALIGALQVQEGLFLLHEAAGGGLRAGQKLYLGLKPHSLFVVDLMANDECLAHQRLLADVKLAIDPGKNSVSDLFQYVSEHVGPVDCLELRHDLLVSLRCDACSSEEAVCVPVKLAPVSLAACRTCGGHRVPILTHRVVRGDRRASMLLRDLGIPNRSILTLSNDSRGYQVELTA